MVLIRLRISIFTAELHLESKIFIDRGVSSIFLWYLLGNSSYRYP